MFVLVVSWTKVVLTILMAKVPNSRKFGFRRCPQLTPLIGLSRAVTLYSPQCKQLFALGDWSFVSFSMLLLINSCPVTLEMTSHPPHALFGKLLLSAIGGDEWAHWDPLTMTLEKRLYSASSQNFSLGWEKERCVDSFRTRQSLMSENVNTLGLLARCIGWLFFFFLVFWCLRSARRN